jgi:hypothetical protein
MLVVSLLFLSFFFEADTEDKLAIVVVVLGVWCSIAMFGLMIAFFVNFQPDIKVSQEGLYIQVFIFWWVFVPWANIEAIRPTWISCILPTNSSRIILVERLTPVHRLFGLYAFSFRPGFLLRRQMKGFDELLTIIENNIENRQTLSSQTAR